MSEGEDENREVEEILDKRLVEGKEPWYLIKWKNVDQYVLLFLPNFIFFCLARAIPGSPLII